MPDFFDVLKGRRSVRSYSEEPVSEEQLQELVDLAILAPSAMNLQPWRFTVITNRQALADVNTRVKEILCEQHIAEKMKMENLQAALSAPDFSIFYHAPALVVITAEKGNTVAAIDCQLAAENLFLAAHARGLGTCYMGFLFFGQEDPKVREALRIPDGHEMVAACCVGHPAAMPEGPPQRRPAHIDWVR
jgi:nitroreductase